MLITEPQYLTTEQLAKLKEWLRSEGCAIFKSLLQARVQEKQIEATHKFADPRERMDIDGRALLKATEACHHALDLLDEFSQTDKKFYTVRVVENFTTPKQQLGK